MKRYSNFEVAISDADRAEIEALYIELMREHDVAQHSTDPNASPSTDPSSNTGAQ